MPRTQSAVVIAIALMVVGSPALAQRQDDGSPPSRERRERSREVRIDPERDEALQAKYRVPTLPAVIFVDADGRELGRWEQNLSARGFIAAMHDVVASHPLAGGVSR